MLRRKNPEAIFKHLEKKPNEISAELLKELRQTVTDMRKINHCSDKEIRDFLKRSVGDCKEISKAGKEGKK